METLKRIKELEDRLNEYYMEKELKEQKELEEMLDRYYKDRELRLNNIHNNK